MPTEPVVEGVEGLSMTLMTLFHPKTLYERKKGLDVECKAYQLYGPRVLLTYGLLWKLLGAKSVMCHGVPFEPVVEGVRGHDTFSAQECHGLVGPLGPEMHG